MNHVQFLIFLSALFSGNYSLVAAPQSEPIARPDLVIQEADGYVAVEAEHFLKQEKADVRAWYLTTGELTPELHPDADPPHVAGASGGGYLEVLPDTRRNHSEKLIAGENFMNEPGKMAVLSYRVHFSTPGKYYVWARTHSTGTEDNGLHVGVDGTWPPSGQRMQWTGKNKWVWGSKQRTGEVHTGVPGILFLDIEEAGEHTIQFSMREDGFEFDQWLMTLDPDFVAPAGAAKLSEAKSGEIPSAFSAAKQEKEKSLHSRRGQDGSGDVAISGELQQWHDITLNLDGPFANERDTSPNPFLDYRLDVTFTHESGTTYLVPGYFAADGKAGESSAESGSLWRVHFAPDLMGEWTYAVSFRGGDRVAIDADVESKTLSPFHGKKGSFTVLASDKTGRDFRGKGRLGYVGKHQLQHLGTGEYFLKAGADAPETFLGYADFDGTVANKAGKVPLKTWSAHVQDWNEGDPVWQGGKGKGMIGAINYLSGKGCNVFSFLTYNAGGDGDNVWPFVERDLKFHYDCSKLDQWNLVFDHATVKGMYLHFKLQETENDDNRKGHKKPAGGEVPTSLDGGDLGDERKLYCREMIARFGHHLALNWNLGEENTQSTEQQIAMADYIAEVDPYDHLIVVHTYPDQQDKVYRPLLGKASMLRGASLQNSNIRDCHKQIVKWTRASAEAGVPWVVSFDEPGTASEGMPADPGYPGMPDNFDNPSVDDTRKFVLWGSLLGGGGGVEYYFGYKLPQNDLVCEDWRSRDISWGYCNIALRFFEEEAIPVGEMQNADELIGNTNHDNSGYCFADAGQVYLVYLPEGGERSLDLSDASGEFELRWFNPRDGTMGSGSASLKGGKGKATLSAPDSNDDWLAVIKRK
ncbi:DUF5060 domain-containing protein [Verrucomicrobiales bacterium BCK34]|nr:DUF5060 domain-containing protein [Verrucomicrobiales bacterium BCK34]